MDVDSGPSLVQAYRGARVSYAHLAALVARQVRGLLRKEGLVNAEVTFRAKEVLSLAKKVLTRPHYQRLDDVPDLAGVRVSVPTLGDCVVADRLIQEAYPDCGREDKSPGDAESFGYLGIHYDLRLGDRHVSRAPSTIRHLRCEVQLHTRVQTAWAIIAHSTVYKPSMAASSLLRRNLARLVALLEIFDLEADRGLLEMRDTPGFEVSKLVEELQREFIGVSDHVGDPELSLFLVPILKRSLFADVGYANVAARVAQLTKANRTYIRDRIRRYARDDRRPLMSQPEVLLLWERLDSDMFQVIAEWPAELDDSLLRETALALGYALPDDE